MTLTCLFFAILYGYIYITLYIRGYNMRLKGFLALVSWVFLLSGLALSSVPAMAGSTTIRVAGSTTVLPVATRAAEKYMAAHPGVRITVNPGGSGVGVKSIGRGTVEIGMVSREITGKERKYFKDADFHVIRFARDAVACVVSSEVYEGGVKSLSKKQIRAIYSGKIKNWKEVGGPDRAIFVIDKEAHRGTRHVFMEYVFGEKTPLARGADLVSGSNNEEQTKVALSDSAIGMLSIAWLDKDVKGIAIVEEGRSIEPTIANIKNNSYPISRDLTFVTNGEPVGEVRAFLDYITGPAGRRIIVESGYVPLQ